MRLSRVWVAIMTADFFLRGQRPSGAGCAALMGSALIVAALLASDRAASAQAANQAAAQPETTAFTIIVTRHGVRAITPPSTLPGPQPDYAWPNWSPLKADDLSAHGYRLMRL